MENNASSLSLDKPILTELVELFRVFLAFKGFQSLPKKSYNFFNMKTQIKVVLTSKMEKKKAPLTSIHNKLLVYKSLEIWYNSMYI